MPVSDFADYMSGGCSDVLESMFFASVMASTHEESVPALSEEAYTFGLSFSEDFRGNFGLQIDKKTAAYFAANFLGEDESEVSEQSAKEVVGELANMLCGSVTSRAYTTRKVSLSHPEPLTEESLRKLESPYVLKIETDGGFVTTWISLEHSPVAA